MFHEIVNRSSGKLRLAGIAKVCHFLTVQIVAKPRRDRVWLSDVIGNTVGCPCTIRTIVVDILMIVMVHCTSEDSLEDKIFKLKIKLLPVTFMLY